MFVILESEMLKTCNNKNNVDIVGGFTWRNRVGRPIFPYGSQELLRNQRR